MSARGEEYSGVKEADVTAVREQKGGSHLLLLADRRQYLKRKKLNKTRSFANFRLNGATEI